MIGRELQGDCYRSDFTPSSQKEAAITATNLKYKEELKSVSITLKKGESLGVGGLASCGMHTFGKTGSITAFSSSWKKLFFPLFKWEKQ